MTTARVRTALFGCSAIALIMIASACSSGTDKVSVGPTTTRAAHTSSESDATSTSGKPSTTTAKKKAKKSKSSKPHAATSTTRGGSASGTLGTITTDGSSVYVPVGGATPPTNATPVTATPTTATPTTVASGPKPYDPSQPIDLSGTPGVTPAEQARAEKLVRDSLRDLPKYASHNTAYADGYRSIGDALTGDEHYINWSYLTDGRILDSKHPESLVYEIRNGKETLVAAMYMLELGSTFADVPDVGGPLTQWHVHNDLCLVNDPNDPLRKYVALPSSGTCPPGSSKATATPMIHVWIVKNACGPFASLEGIGAGQVPPGETRNCDKAHGSS